MARSVLWALADTSIYFRFVKSFTIVSYLLMKNLTQEELTLVEVGGETHQSLCISRHILGLLNVFKMHKNYTYQIMDTKTLK